MLMIRLINHIKNYGNRKGKYIDFKGLKFKWHNNQPNLRVLLLLINDKTNREMCSIKEEVFWDECNLNSLKKIMRLSCWVDLTIKFQSFMQDILFDKCDFIFSLWLREKSKLLVLTCKDNLQSKDVENFTFLHKSV